MGIQLKQMNVERMHFIQHMPSLTDSIIVILIVLINGSVTIARRRVLGMIHGQKINFQNRAGTGADKMADLVAL
jgi:hypothetical protein